MDNRLKPYEEKMNQSVQAMRNDFQSMKAGRANQHVLDKVMVEYYGTPTPLNQLCNISIPEARILQIQPFDKSSLKDIEKAINIADIGIHPTNDGSVIRLVFPDLTEDRRKEISKEVKKRGDDAKVSIRNVRKDAMDFIKKLSKDKEITEDDEKTFTDDIQKVVDKLTKDVDTEVDNKTKEIMKV